MKSKPPKQFKKFKILLDMDDVTCYLSKPWEKWIQDNGDPSFLWENVQNWNVHEWTAIGKKCYDFLSIPGIFLDLEPLPEAIPMINKLKTLGHTIHFCTADPLNSLTKPGNDRPNAQIEKIEWLKHHFKWFNPDTDITFSHDKGTVPGDILFDDRAKWGYEFPGIFICKATNYNKNWTGFRVNTWLEFFQLIQDLSKYAAHDPVK